MKTKILGILTALLLMGALPACAAPTYTWNQVRSSNCPAVTGVNTQVLCWDTTLFVMYTCSPASGSTCSTSADWKAGGGGWVDTGVYLYPLAPTHPVVIGSSSAPAAGIMLDVVGNMHLGSNLFRCDASNGCRFDVDNNGSTDVTISALGLFSTSGGYNYTGTNQFFNVTRSSDKTVGLNVGDAWYNSAGPYWGYYTGSLVKRFITEPIYANTFTPVASSNTLLWKMPYNGRIETINCIVDPGGSSSDTINIQVCNANGSSCANVDTSSIACGNTNSADDGSLASPTAVAGSWINLNQTTVSGSPAKLAVTVKYSLQP